jgi:hypothetical protein
MLGTMMRAADSINNTVIEAEMEAPFIPVNIYLPFFYPTINVGPERYAHASLKGIRNRFIMALDWRVPWAWQC